MDYEDVKYVAAKKLLAKTPVADIELNALEHLPKGTTLSEVDMPFGWKSILEGKGMLAKRARNYLTERGFDLEMLDMMGFGYCDEEAEEEGENFFGRIIIPFKISGRLVYYQGRTFIDDFLRYKNPPTDAFGVGKGDLVFNEDALAIRKTVCVIEGWADAVTIGKAACSTQGWKLSATQKSKFLMAECENLIFVPDKGFYVAAVKTAMNFMEEKKCYVVNVDNICPDQPDKKDVNEFGLAALKAEIAITPLLTMETAMKAVLGK